jgi:cytochrome c biogenesis protein CcmG/thiol:disulfide interchange protein DsbE
MKKKLSIFPSILFLLILFSFFYLLISDHNPSKLPSTFIDRPVPIFKAKTLIDNETFISTEEFGQETTLVNFFATWCKPCVEELVFLKKLASKNELKIIGINYKDNSNKTVKWFKELGNPYSKVIVDSNALIGIDWGVYGIPETFIVNSKGIIKYRLVGPITEKNYDEFYVKIKESEK